MVRRASALLLATVALAGCVGAYAPYQAGQPGSYVRDVGAGRYRPGDASAGARVAILLPLSGPRADLGQAMLHAAQLAYETNDGRAPLDAHDTGGTPEGAAKAAQDAAAAGDGLILGPLTSAETAAAAPVAQAAGIPVLAFTNDSSQARPGVWPLGISPLQQVTRLAGAAQADGKTRLAAVLPQTEFGRAMETALNRAALGAGLPPPSVREYGPGMASITAAVRDVSDYAGRRGVLDQQARAARAEGTPEGRARAADISKQGVPPAPFDALLLADTGETLTEIASLLPYYDVGAPAVRLLGPALWANPGSGSGQFPGAWYAAPDPASRQAFDAQYTAKFGSPAPALADVAFDAATLARDASASGGFSAQALSAAPLIGADGLLALSPDGTVRRGLAVFEVRRGGAQVVDPAPTSPSAPGV
jgi:hypothetical protein